MNIIIKKSNPVMDAKLKVNDMFIQNKNSADKKAYTVAEVLGEYKLININSGQTYNKDGYEDLTRQEVLDIVSSHFDKYTWTFIPAEKIVSKDLTVVLKG